jgi:hypothetical protein
MSIRTLAFIAVAGAVIVALLLAIAVRGEEPRWTSGKAAAPMRQRVRSGDLEAPAAMTGPYRWTVLTRRAAALLEPPRRAAQTAPDGGVT